MPFMRALKLLDLPFQPLDHLTGVPVQTCLAVRVAGQFSDPGFQRFNLIAGAGLLFGQLIALDHQALQDGRGNCLFLALGRQGVFGRFAQFGSVAGIRLGLRGLNHALAQNTIRLRPGQIRLAPAAEQKLPFHAAQLLADLAVAGRLLGLARQGGKLLGQLLQHVIHAQKVGLGAGEFQLGLMAAGVQARNPGRLFQHAAARLGFGVDEFRNLPLPHQGRAMRAGRGIGKQHLHVTRPHVFGVQLIG